MDPGPLVVPNQRLQGLINTFLTVLAVEGFLCILLVLTGQIWVLMALISTGCGWFAVKDQTVHKPKFMNLYFSISVLSCVLGSAQFLLFLSVLIQDHEKWASALAATLIWGSLVGVLVVAARVSWVMYKEMLTCSAAGAASFTFSYGGGAMPPGASGDGQLPTTPTAADFHPFTGEGRRLGA